jgi:hypothetical protein
MLAKFNEELAPLFGILQQLDGLQLAPHLLEPPLPLPKLETETMNGTVNRRATALGGTSHGGNNFPRFDMYTQQGITVNIEGDANSSNAEVAVKDVPTWLQDSAHVDAVGSVPTAAETEQASLAVAAHIGLSSPPTASRAVAESPRAVEHDVVASLLQHEIEQHKLPTTVNPSEPMRMETERETESSDDESFEDVEIEVMVQGQKYPLAHVTNNPQLISQMTEAERSQYVKIVQDQMMDHDFD